MTTAKHLLIAGRVQGVFYRASTKHEAQRLSLSGWVKNLTDGRVEAVVQGPADDLDELIAWCRTGPAGARVDGVEVTDRPVDSLLNGFRVLY